MTISIPRPGTQEHLQPLRSGRTHEVANQATARVDIDEFAANQALVDAVAAYAPAADTGKLHRIGAHVGTAEYQDNAQLANTFIPRHHPFGRWGNRVDEIEFHPGYHAIMEYSIAEGCTPAHGPTPGRERTCSGPPASTLRGRSSRAIRARCP